MINRESINKYYGIKTNEDYTTIIEDISLVEENAIFIVRKGQNYDAFKDIEKALQYNCLILHENKNEERGYYIENLHCKTEALIKEYYLLISSNFKIVGVVGTNGKSSVVSYLYKLAQYNSIKIGTGFIECAHFSIESENTTPSSILLFYTLLKAYKNNITHVFMEVSSIAIDKKRISFLLFDTLIYTNIARDHMDYHKTNFHYRYSKYKAMQYLRKEGIVIVNKDELYYEEIKKLCKHTLITYGTKASHFQIQDVLLKKNGTIFYVNRFFYRTSLLSFMNVYNLTCCIAYLRYCDISYFEIYKRILLLKPLEGRLEVVYDSDFCIIVDYAHTTQAFFQMLSFFSSIKKHRLLCVVGCGGEREKEKREEIGYFATTYCDFVIFTEDNSRKEELDLIINGMKKRSKENYKIIMERGKAIESAILMAEKDDIIIVSGKGNEQFLLQNGSKIPFNDKKKIKEILE